MTSTSMVQRNLVGKHANQSSNNPRQFVTLAAKPYLQSKPDGSSCNFLASDWSLEHFQKTEVFEELAFRIGLHRIYILLFTQ